MADGTGGVLYLRDMHMLFPFALSSCICRGQDCSRDPLWIACAMSL